MDELPSPAQGGPAIEPSGRPPQDTFILGGQPYVYTEQDWDCFPEVAKRAFLETQGAMFVYLMGVYTGKLIENGVLLSITEMKARLVELAAGLYWLAPYAMDIQRFIRRTVNVLLVPLIGTLLFPDTD